MFGSIEIVPKNLVSEIIPFLTFAALPLWQLGCHVKWKRPDVRELITKCIVPDIDFLFSIFVESPLPNM
jgi:hypothetical protein